MGEYLENIRGNNIETKNTQLDLKMCINCTTNPLYYFQKERSRKITSYVTTKRGQRLHSL